MTSNTFEDDYVQVTTKMRRRRVMKTAYNKSPADGEKVPAVRFSGSWLSDLGFVVGGRYELLVNRDQSVTVKAIRDEQEEES